MCSRLEQEGGRACVVCRVFNDCDVGEMQEKTLEFQWCSKGKQGRKGMCLWLRKSVGYSH